MNIDNDYVKHDTKLPIARYVSPIKPVSTPLVMALIAGAVLLVLIIALKMGSGLFPAN